MPLYVCTFVSSEDPQGLARAEALRHSALTVGGADHVVVLDEKHKLMKMLKGTESEQLRFDWGYWKPYVIDFVLHNVKDGDVVAFVDASVQFTAPIMADDKDVVLFSSHKVLKQYCTQDCFAAAGTTVDDKVCGVDSRVQIYRKSADSMAFVKRYLTLCSTPEAMDTSFRVPNDPTFKMHEHEQSVLGVLSASSIVSVLPSYAQFLASSPEMTFRKTVVVTPTIGTAHLARCIESVQSQTLLGVEHLIVVDGPEYAEAVEAIVEPFLLKRPIRTMVLPANVGAGGWCGHRVYASIPYLVDADYVAYLDEDNTYAEDHLSSMLELVTSRSLDWAYSLRRIVDKEGRFLANDNCESLGGLCHTVLGWQDFLVDTSCYLFSIQVARAVSPHWMHRTRQKDGQEADRSVTKFLLAHSTFKGGCTKKYSLNYTVASNASTSVTGQFFVGGNTAFKYDFGGKPTLYIFHFNAEQTQAFLMTMHKTDRSYALDEWQMTLLRGLTQHFNLVNGFAVEAFIPPGSVVYISMCHLHELPSATLQRNDIQKILYTLESPNIRHQQQWDLGFLRQHFNHLMTYWTPLLTAHPSATFCPHNTHHLDLDNVMDRRLLYTPKAKVGRDVAMVLECRDLCGDYAINGVALKCLDPLRKHYVESLKDITVYGIGWDRFRANPLLKVGHTKHRSLDNRSTVDILKDYTFALIIENTNADGYVSEKIYDAWIAGCIPLYYGNINENTAIPKQMYIDIKNFETSQDLQSYLTKMTLKDIRAKRKFIVENREKVLRNVSTTAFADAFQKVYEKACK